MINFLWKIVQIFWLIATLPIAFIYGFIKNRWADQKISKIPLDLVVKRTAFFLKPQLDAMWQLGGNKYALVDFSSLMYILSLAQALGGRPIFKEEDQRLLLSILGNDFKRRIDAILEPLHDGTADRQVAAKIVMEVKLIAESDAREGMLGCSSFLLNIAEESSRWQRSIEDTSN
jgi:hypothetical protein